MDVLEELLIDLVGQIQQEACWVSAIDTRPLDPSWEEAVIEVVAAAPVRARARYVGLLAQFFRDLDRRRSAVVPDLAKYREAIRTLVNQRIARRVPE